MADVYDELLHIISKEAVRLAESDETPNGIGPGGCAAAVMSTLIFSWADLYGPHAESNIDSVVKTAKETLRQKRADKAAKRH